MGHVLDDEISGGESLNFGFELWGNVLMSDTVEK